MAGEGAVTSLSTCLRDHAGVPGRFTAYQRVLEAHEDRSGVLQISLRFPSTRYFEEFMALRCAGDLIEQELFPNAKEITESFAAYRAARRHTPFALDDTDVTVAVIGDGKTPRTAATFAFRSRWLCISIDPQMAFRRQYARIERLECIPKKIEFVGKREFKKLIIVAPHSHAPLEVALDRLTAKDRHIIAMPCCVEQTIGRPADIQYDDFGIWSPARAVRVWNDV